MDAIKPLLLKFNNHRFIKLFMLIHNIKTLSS